MSSKPQIMVIASLEEMRSIDSALEAGATTFAGGPVNGRPLGHHVKFMVRADRAIRCREAFVA